MPSLSVAPKVCAALVAGVTICVSGAAGVLPGFEPPASPVGWCPRVGDQVRYQQDDSEFIWEVVQSLPNGPGGFLIRRGDETAMAHVTDLRPGR